MCDMGCGTGNYVVALLKHGVGKVSLMDANEDMLQKAKEKINDMQKMKSVDALMTSVLPEVPFCDNSFDACIINMVGIFVSPTLPFPCKLRFV